MNFRNTHLVCFFFLSWLTINLVQGSSILRQLDKLPLNPRQKGVVLINELGCVSCHDSSQNHFKTRKGPSLSGVIDRVQVDWLKDFLKSPHNQTGGASLPGFSREFQDSGKLTRGEIQDALLHFLVSESTGVVSKIMVSDASVTEGDRLFHTIGCVACHGPKSSEHGAAWIRTVREKFKPQALHSFLLDPLKTHPDARMPDMHLTHKEALDLTAFFMDGLGGSAKDNVFDVDPVKAKTGESLARQLRCHSCHQIENIPVADAALTLETLGPGKGCLSSESGPWPEYRLTHKQRSWIESALKSETQWTLSERIQMQLAQFNCVVCHERGGIGGVSDNLDSFFTSQDPNLGKQGRIPPSLNGVGAKLNPTWLRKIIVQGARSRPYMNVRMPRFGPHVQDELMELLVTEDTIAPIPVIEMPNVNDSRRAGRDLAGTKGMGCITCHAFKGTQSGAMGAVDMALMGQRLTRDWFHHYLRHPQRFSPGTLMPDFWPEENSTKPEILDGDASKQIQALWIYLSDGYSLGAPSGLHREPMRLVAEDLEAVMLRRSYPGVGKRGIGVGLPNGLNYVFHAEQLTLAMLWKGEFADPAGVWSSQGHGRVRPLARNQISFPSEPQWQVLESKQTPWPVEERRPAGQAFRGYRLDVRRRPTFLYEVSGANIEDSFREIQGDNQWILEREIQITNNQDSEGLYFRAGVVDEIQVLGERRFRLGKDLIISSEGQVDFHVLKSVEGDELRFIVPADTKVQSLTLHYEF